MDLIFNKLDDSGRCRWSTLTDEPILFVKYGSDKLNILDTEEKLLILKNSVQLDECIALYPD